MSEQRTHHVSGLEPGHVALMKDLAEACAEKSIKNVLRGIGLDPSNPIEAQDTFAALRRIAKRMDDPEAVADAGWTRRTRNRMEGALGKAMMTAVAVAVAGALHAAWTGAAALLPDIHR